MVLFKWFFQFYEILMKVKLHKHEEEMMITTLPFLHLTIVMAMVNAFVNAEKTSTSSDEMSSTTNELSNQQCDRMVSGGDPIRLFARLQTHCLLLVTNSGATFDLQGCQVSSQVDQSNPVIQLSGALPLRDRWPQLARLYYPVLGQAIAIVDGTSKEYLWMANQSSQGSTAWSLDKNKLVKIPGAKLTTTRSDQILLSSSTPLSFYRLGLTSGTLERFLLEGGPSLVDSTLDNDSNDKVWSLCSADGATEEGLLVRADHSNGCGGNSKTWPVLGEAITSGFVSDNHTVWLFSISQTAQSQVWIFDLNGSRANRFDFETVFSCVSNESNNKSSLIFTITAIVAIVLIVFFAMLALFAFCMHRKSSCWREQTNRWTELNVATTNRSNPNASNKQKPEKGGGGGRSDSKRRKRGKKRNKDTRKDTSTGRKRNSNKRNQKDRQQQRDGSSKSQRQSKKKRTGLTERPPNNNNNQTGKVSLAPPNLAPSGSRKQQNRQQQQREASHKKSSKKVRAKRNVPNPSGSRTKSQQQEQPPLLPQQQQRRDRPTRMPTPVVRRAPVVVVVESGAPVVPRPAKSSLPPSYQRPKQEPESAQYRQRIDQALAHL